VGYPNRPARTPLVRVSDARTVVGGTIVALLGVARAIASAGFHTDDPTAEELGIDGVRPRPEQAERRATAGTRNHGQRDVAAGHQRGTGGPGGDHESDDPCAKSKRKRKSENRWDERGGVSRVLWKGEVSEHETCNPRARDSQQHQRNSSGAVRVSRRKSGHSSLR
jgi:hypothetical protein